MIKFKKGYNAKILSILAAIIFILNSAVYGIDLPKNPHLRVPLAGSSSDGKARLRKVMNRQANAELGLLNSQKESFQSVRTRIESYFVGKKAHLWTPPKPGTIQVDFIEYLKMSRDRSFKYGSLEEEREALRLQGLTNNELESDPAVQRLLKSFGDLEGRYTLVSLLDRLSESYAGGLIHHIGTSTGPEILLRKMISKPELSIDRKRESTELLRRAILYKVLIRELIYRWSLADVESISDFDIKFPRNCL